MCTPLLREYLIRVLRSNIIKTTILSLEVMPNVLASALFDVLQFFFLTVHTIRTPEDALERPRATLLSRPYLADLCCCALVE